MKLDTLLICFLIAFGSASATGARQELRSDVSYSEGNQREGRYKYGYAVKEGETQFHHQRSLNGAVYGCYGFVDPLGKLFITHYLADMAGYRLVNMANPDKKLLERIQSLGSADHPIELQSFFPLECQGDSDIKVLQETAAQMRSSLRSTPNGHARSTSNQQFSGASLVHSEKTNLKSSDHVLVKASESTAAEVTQEKAIHQQSETSLEENVDVEQSTPNTLDSTVQPADVSMEVDTANQRKDSIDSSKSSEFRSHTTEGNRFAGGLHNVDNHGFIRVKVVYDNEDSQATRKRPDVKAEIEGSPIVESKGFVRTSFEAPGSSDELNESDAKFKLAENMRKSELLIVPADDINNDDEPPMVTQSVEMEYSTEINLQLSENALASDRGQVTYGVSSSSTIESDMKVSDEASSNLSSENIAVVDGSLIARSVETESQLSSESMDVVNSENTENVELSGLKATVKDDKNSNLSSENIAVVEESLATDSPLQAERELSLENMGVIEADNTRNVELSKLKSTVKDGTSSILRSEHVADVKGSLLFGSVLRAESLHSSEGMDVVNSENTEGVEIGGLKATVKAEIGSILSSHASVSQAQHGFGSIGSENTELVELSGLKASVKDETSSVSRSDNVAEVKGSLATESALQVETLHSSEGMGVIHSQNTEHIEISGLKTTVKNKTRSHLSSGNDADVKGALAIGAALQAESQEGMGAVNAANSEYVEISGRKATVKDETSSIMSSEHVADVKGSLATRSALQAESQHSSEGMGVVHVVDLSRSKIIDQSSIVRNKGTAGLKLHSNDQQHSENGDALKSNSMFRGRVKYTSSSLQPGTKTSYSYNSGQYKPDNRGLFKSSSTEASSRFGQPSFKTSTGAGIRDVLGSDRRATVAFKSGSSNGIGSTQSSLKSNTDTRGSIRSSSVSTKPGVNTIQSIQRDGSSISAIHVTGQHPGNIQESDRTYSESGKKGASSGNIKSSVGTFSVSTNSDSSSKSTVKSSSGNTGIGGKGLTPIHVSESIKSSEIDGSRHVLGEIKESGNKASESSFKSGSDIIQNNHRGVSSNQLMLKSVQDDRVIVKPDHDVGKDHESNIKYSMPLKTSTHAGSSGNIKNTGRSSQSSNLDLSSQSTLRSSTEDSETSGERLSAIRVSGSYESSKIVGSPYSGQVLGDIKGSVRTSSESFKSGSHSDESSNQQALETSTVKAESDTAAIQVQDDGVIVKADHDEQLHEVNTNYSMPLKSKTSVGSSENIKSTAGSSSEVSNLDSSSQLTLRSSTGDTEIGGKQSSVFRGSVSFENSRTGGSAYTSQVLGNIKASVITSSESFKSGSNNGESSNQQALESSTVKAEYDTAAIQVQDDQDAELNTKYSMPLKSSTNAGSFGKIKSTSGSFSDSSTQSSLSSSSGDTETGGLRLTAIRGSGSFTSSKTGGSPYSGQVLGGFKGAVRTSSESFKSGSNNGESLSQLALESATEKTEYETTTIQVQDDGMIIKSGDSSLSSEVVGEIKESVESTLKQGLNVTQSADFDVSSNKSVQTVTTNDSADQDLEFTKSSIRSSTVSTNLDGSKASQSIFKSPAVEVAHGTMLGDNSGSLRSSSGSFQQNPNVKTTQIGGSASQLTSQSSTLEVVPVLPVVDNAKAVDSNQDMGHIRVSESVGLDGRLSQSTFKSSSVENIPAMRRIPAIRVPEYVEQRIKNAASSTVPMQPSQEYAFTTRSTLTSRHPVESKITSVSNFGASGKRTDMDDSVVVEATDEDTQRLMIPKLPATPRTTIAGSSEPVTVANSIISYTNKPPVHPHPTTEYRPSISNVYYQAGATTTTVKPELPARSTVGPSGDVYDEIDEDPAPSISPISASHPTQMSPQIPSIPNSGSGITIHPSIASHCYEVILQIPADAKQVLLKTESSSFRVYGDGDPYNRVKLVQPGVYEVNIAATNGIKFQQYQNHPQNDASKLQLDLGKGFNYGELVPTPANREAIDYRDPTLNNPYLPQVTIEKARSVGSVEVVTVGEDSYELTAEQRALLNLVPSWKKVLQNY